MSDTTLPHRSVPRARGLWSAVALVGLAIAAATFGAYRAQTGDLAGQAEAELSAVAALQVERLEDWHHERAAEATYVGAQQGLARRVGELGRGSDDPAARAEVSAVLEPLLRNHEYRAAFLLDPAGRELAHFGAASEVLSLGKLDLATIHESVLLNFRQTPSDGPSSADLVVPLQPTDAQHSSAGFAVLRLAPEEAYARVLAKWPTPHRSGQTYLVRRDGDDLVYLTSPGAAPGRLTSLRRPANEAALGERPTDGAVEGTGPRGTPIVALVRPVSGTPWSVVARIDRAELLAEARARAVSTIGFGAAATGLVAALFALGLRSRAARLVASRLRAEVRQRELAQRYEYLFRRGNDAMLLMDADLRILDANDRAVALYGWSHHELCRLTGPELRTAEARAAAERDLATTIDEGGAVFETVHRRKDGTSFTAEVSARPVEIDRRRHIEATVRDTSARHAAEQHLRRLVRANRLFGGVGQAIARLTDRQALFDETCRVAVESGELCLAAVALLEPTTGSLRVAACAGKARAIVESLLEQPSAGGRPAHDQAALVSLEQGVSVVDDVANDARVAKARDGLLAAGIRAAVTCPLRVHGRVVGALRLGAGEPGFFGGDDQGTLAHVAESLSFALEAFEREEQRRVLTQLVEQSSSLVLVTDTAGTIEYVNPRFTEVTGYALSDLRGQTPRVLKSNTTPAETHVDLWNTLLAGRTWRGEMVNRTRQGTTYVAALTASPIVNEAGEVSHFVGTQEDVTVRRLLEAELQQAQKLESMGLLAGGVAHDFNNLLTAILGFAGFLVEGLPADSPERADALEIHRAGERAAALTRQLLAFSRRQPISPVTVNVSELVIELAKMLRRLIGESIELSVVPASAGPFVLADPGQLEQVIVNLSVNARDAMPTGGLLRIEVGLLDIPESAGPTAPRAGNYARICVTDTGTGMSEATLARMFEPFFTTKEKGHGTGLGLATCFGIVKQSAGHLRVRSKLGEGSVFEVLLPALLDGQGVQAREATPSAGVPGRGTVLVVEDEKSVRVMVKRVLSEAGYDVVTATHGEEALALLRAPSASFALLVSDVVMPRMGGAALAAEARALRPDLPVLLISGYADDAGIDLLGLGPQHFLPKPFTAAALRKRVGELLAGD